MTKKTSSNAHATRALVAALIGVIAIPTAMTGLFQSIDDDGTNVVPVIDLRHRALNDASRVRNIRRNYWRAVDIYNELVRIGVKDLTPPSIYDVDSINYFLKPENFASVDGAEEIVHAAAPLEEGDDVIPGISKAEADYRDLPEMYRDLLDGYMTTSRCPGSLRQFHLAGFYDLCRRLLDERLAKDMSGVLQRSAYLRGFQPVGYAPLRNLRNRLENLQESLIFDNGTSVRPRWHSIDSFRPSLRSTDQ